ncbi:hypothetical protein GCM10023185_33600 [Hymenobacter saemangeumensis]|uniref:Uncharacterized protein n=1 Tax=Hymenobacter saemangeumensis TaxID=1084522 RepID=A0ABP8INE2_9BACT
MLRFPQFCFLLLGLQAGCGDAAQRPPAGPAAPVAEAPPAAPARKDSVPIPYGPPAVIAKMDPNYRYSDGDVAFSDTIDKQIAQAALPPGPQAWERCEFIRYTTNDRLDETECCNDWTPWITEFCALGEFLPWGEDSDTTGGRYPRPVSLPNAAGRQLFLAQSAEYGFGPIVLLEFRGGRYRARVLGQHSAFGGIRHRLYRPAGAELLVLENTYGHMGAGRGSSGQAVRWLQVYDLRQDKWLFSALVGQTEEYHGYTTDDGREVPGRYLEASCSYALRDQGRTIVLGRYRPDTDEAPDESAVVHPLPAGTYRLVAGRYRRVGGH